MLIVLFTCRTYPGCPSLTCRKIQVNIGKDWSKPCHKQISFTLQWAMILHWEKSGFLKTNPGSRTFPPAKPKGLLKTQPTQENWRKNIWTCTWLLIYYVFLFFFFFSTRQKLFRLMDFKQSNCDLCVFFLFCGFHQWRHVKLGMHRSDIRGGQSVDFLLE